MQKKIYLRPENKPYAVEKPVCLGLRWLLSGLGLFGLGRFWRFVCGLDARLND